MSSMTRTKTCMCATWKQLSTCLATRRILSKARNVAHLLVRASTHLVCQNGTRCIVLTFSRMARQDALMTTRSDLSALIWTLSHCSTRNIRSCSSASASAYHTITKNNCASRARGGSMTKTITGMISTIEWPTTCLNAQVLRAIRTTTVRTSMLATT